MRTKWISILIALSLIIIQPRRVHPVVALTDVDVITTYLLPDEHAVTYPYRLHENGRDYTLHFVVHGVFSPQSDRDLLAYPGSLINRKTVTAVLITVDGQVVEDETQINTLLSLWQAGYQLYHVQHLVDRLNWIDTENFSSDMSLVLKNPVFIQQMLQHAVTGQSTDYRRDAWRGILEDQRTPPASVQLITSTIQEELAAGTSLEDAISGIKDASEFIKGRGNMLPEWFKAVRRQFKGWKPELGNNGQYNLFGRLLSPSAVLQVFGYGARLLWITDLQSERAAWLPAYDAMFSDDYLRLEPEQTEAMWDVYEEAQDTSAQRWDILETIIKEVAFDSGAGLGQDALKIALTKKAVTVFGTKLTGHAVLAGLVAVDAGLTVADYLYGFDALYDNFQVAQESDLLRLRFRAGRIELEGRALQLTSGGTYDANLIRQYQVVYMLESLAAAQMVRSYADGMEATLKDNLISFLDPVRWLEGKERKQAIADLHQAALDGEADAEDTVLRPAWVPEAARLGLDRIALLARTVDDASAHFTQTGPTAYWKALNGGFGGAAVWTKNEGSQAQNTGQWSVLITETGVYRAQAYIPAPTGDITLPYSESAQYVIAGPSNGGNVVASQATAAGAWLDLGLYYVEAGQTVTVKLGDRTAEATGTRALVFDALQWVNVPLSEVPNLYDAVQVEPAFDVVIAGETAVLTLTIQNTGLMPWLPDDIVLVGGATNTKDAPASFVIEEKVPPGGVITETISLPITGTLSVWTLTYQMEQRGGRSFGQSMSAQAFVLPPELRDIEDELRRQAREVQEQGQQAAEDLARAIQEAIQQEIERQARKQLDQWCGGPVSTALLTSLALLRVSRRRPRDRP